MAYFQVVDLSFFDRGGIGFCQFTAAAGGPNTAPYRQYGGIPLSPGELWKGSY